MGTAMGAVRASLVAGAVIFGALVPALGGAPASAAVGACQDPEGVTVVVDLTDLGDGVLVGCAGTGEMTGLQALERAGFSVSGTQRQGLAFVCRVDGRPSPDEKLAVQGQSGYREQCTDTPPPGAYWGYWYAEGTVWAYATTGPSGRQATPGGVEGWRFELNRSQARPVPPSVALPLTAPGPVVPPPEETAAPDRGSAWPTVAVAGATVVLVAGGGVAAWRRSRTR